MKDNKVKIKVLDHEMTIDEAESLYLELKRMFEKNEWPIAYPVPIYPSYPVYGGYDTGTAKPIKFDYIEITC